MSVSGVVRVRCAACPRIVRVDACTTCIVLGDGSECEECGGEGFTVDGHSCSRDDVLCQRCWDAENETATRDWCG